MMAFSYPARPLVRRHGPRGYQSYNSYLPWLRDEFTFRCVFCLRREQWDRAVRLEIDHFRPVSRHSQRKLDYDNLLYACSRCNAAKSDQSIDDPSSVLVSADVTVLADGTLAAASHKAQRLIAQLRLNSIEMIHFRRLWLEIIAMAARADEKLCRELLGFPQNLPNLASLRPPGGNRRPGGLEQSFFARRERNELPLVY